MKQNLERYIAFLLQRPLVLTLLTLLLMMVVISGARFLPEPSSGLRDLMGADNEYMRAFDDFENIYSASNSALIAVTPEDGNVFTHETLAAVEELTEAGWLLPHSIRVTSLTNYSHSVAEGDDLIVGPLVEDSASLDDAALAEVGNIALATDEITGLLVSSQGHVAGVMINFVLPEDGADPLIAEINAAVRELLAEARIRHPKIDYYVTGNVILRAALLEVPLDDLSTLGPILMAVMMIMIVVLLRSLFAVLIVISVVLLMAATAMGFAGWIGSVLTPVTTVVPLIVIILGIAHSIHIVKVTQDHMREGLDKKAAVGESLRINAWPVFLTTLTTAVGFLSLNFSESPSFRSLGNLTAFGAMCSLIFSMTVLPALLSVTPIRAPAKRAGDGKFLESFGDFVVKRRQFLLIFCSITSIGLFAGVTQIELDDNWTRYFDDRYEFRRDTDFITANLSGLDSLEYSLDSGREGGISDPGYLRAVDAFAEWARSQPEVISVQAFPDVLKRLNKNMNGDDQAYYRIPDDPALAAQYLFLYELSLPLGSDLNDRIDLAKSSTRLTIVLGGTSSSGVRDFVARAENWLNANQPDIATTATGFTMVSANIAQLNNQSMILGIALAMGIISLLMIPVFRTFRIGLVCLVPNLVPLGVSFGIWGYLIGYVGFGASAVAAMALGIVVDDTIHFMVKYVRGRREGLSAQESVRLVIHKVAPALLTTSTILTAGFLVFTASGFEGNWVVGWLLSFILVFAICADFLLLPPLLMLIDRAKRNTSRTT